jgi:LmbE family N-acetylglucosaminyl deacetylase
MKVLAVGAHPDDLEILCGGTLARFSREGHSVTMAYSCRGDKGHFEIPPDELAKIRAREARNSASIIGAESIGLGIDDLELRVERGCLMRFVDLIRRVEPDIIITHHPDDYMPDHTITSRLVFDASFIATLPHTKTRYPASRKITPIYHMDTLAGVKFEPCEYVDITETLETKLQMLEKHSSQIEWLSKHDGIDIVEFVKVVARFRGLQAGTKYAEGFCAAHAWGRNVANRYLP